MTHHKLSETKSKLSFAKTDLNEPHAQRLFVHTKTQRKSGQFSQNIRLLLPQQAKSKTMAILWMEHFAGKFFMTNCFLKIFENFQNNQKGHKTQN